MYRTFGNDLVVDDRTSMTIGKRIQSIKELGLPFAIIIGKDIIKNPPLVEVYDVYKNHSTFLQINDLCRFIQDRIKDFNIDETILRKNECNG